MRGARGIAVGLVACVCLATAAEAGAAQLVSSAPSIYPAYRKDAPDYVVRCAVQKEVKFSVAAPAGTKVKVGSRTDKGGTYSDTVPLRPGQAVAIRVTSGSVKRTHHVRCLPADFLAWSAERAATPKARWYLMTPIRLTYHRPGYTVVFDRNGVPVWWMREAKGSPYNGTLLPDGGIAWIPYLDTPFGLDDTRFEEHGLDGSPMRTLTTVGTLTDFHELQPLPNGHVLLDSYRPRDHVDLRPLDPGLPSDATVVDGEVQELDANGTVVWSWSTKGHIPLSDSSRWHDVKPVRLRDGRLAYDIVHPNSVDMHGDRVIVSLRHTDAVYEIDKKTKQVVWKLGGAKTAKSLAFADDPFGGASFGGQHDARESPDGKFLTLFDNRTLRSGPARAVRYAINRSKRKATLVGWVTDPAAPRSICCGSARLLPGGHWVISWGNHSLVTETDASGHRVLAFHFAGEKQSYRALPILPGQLSASKLRAGMDRQAP